MPMTPLSSPSPFTPSFYSCLIFSLNTKRGNFCDPADSNILVENYSSPKLDKVVSLWYNLLSIRNQTNLGLQPANLQGYKE